MNQNDPLAPVERLFDEVGLTTYGDSMNVYNAREAVRLLLDVARDVVGTAVLLGDDPDYLKERALLAFARGLEEK